MYLRETRRTNRDGSVVRYLQLAHNERHPVAGVVEHVKDAARAHQTMIWTRQRNTCTTRVDAAGVLSGRVTAFDDLAGPDALAVLAAAPSPEQGGGIIGPARAHRGEPLVGEPAASPTAHA